MKVSRFLPLILLLIGIRAWSVPKGKLSVNVGEFIVLKGNVYVGLFDSTNRYGLRHTDKAFMRRMVPVTGKLATVVFDSVPAGKYAMVVFQDINGNGKYEYWNEDYGFSKGGVILYKSPSFKGSEFYFDGTDQVHTLELQNEENNTTDNSKSLVYAPVVSYAPESRIQIGASLVWLFKLHKKDTMSRTSYMDMFGLVTQNAQLILKQNYLVFTNKEKYVITGLTWFQYFPQYFFGVGNDLTNANKELVKYHQFKMDVLVQRRVYKKIFMGIGYRNSTIFGVESDTSGLLASSRYTGYDGSVSSGFQTAITSDNRDNIYYATKGHYLRFKSSHHFPLIGSTFTFHIFEAEARKYFRPFANKWDVIAFNAYGYFSGGDVPWNELGAMGSDVLMRGYYSGRYRDKNYIAVQAEYRLPINRLFGIAAFIGTGEVADELQNFTLGGLKPNGGAGIRIKIDRKERMNLRIDMGIGNQGANFYLSAAESF